MNVSGSGSMKLSLEAREISAVITGSGGIELNGTGTEANEMDAIITGSGSFEVQKLDFRLKM